MRSVDPRSPPTCTAFAADRWICSGPLRAVVEQTRAFVGRAAGPAVQVFDDSRGEVLEVDWRGSDDDVLHRLLAAYPQFTEVPPVPALAAEVPRGRGRPRLGVVAREVTLLPRHWDWLSSQPGSASVALRKLVDAARHAHAARDQCRQAQQAVFRFASTMAGNREHFEDALRALFARDRVRFLALIASWPVDIRNHLERLAQPVFEPGAVNEPG